MAAGELFAEERGAGERTIVLLHGFGGTHAIWETIAAHFAATDRVIAYDLPGHGRSLDYPKAGSARVATDAVLADLAARGVAGFHLVGHSFGGAVATLVALQAPQMVRSLTLLAPGGFGDEINGRLLARYATASGADDLRFCLENMAGYGFEITDAVLAPYVKMRAAAGQCDKLVEIAAKLSRDGRQGVIPREQIATLAMPVKVVWGTQDRVLPTRQAHRLPGHIAGHIFEETGHMLPEEIPDAVIRLIAENALSARRALILAAPPRPLA